MATEDHGEPRPTATILDALAGEGEYVGDGGFTLDPERARAKLRDYALDEPEAYVLLLVEAAWLAGLGGIRSRMRVSPGTTTQVEFTSMSLDAAQLANVIGAVFGSGEGLEGEDRARHRTLQKLGLAANAALALEPKRLVIEHLAPDGTSLRLVLAGDGTGEGIERGTHDAGAERPLTRFVFGGSAFNLRRPARERELLTTRAIYAGFPIECEGKRISRGLDAAFERERTPASPPIAVATTEPRKIIGAAIRDRRRLDTPGHLHLVTRGVLSETISSFEPGLRAVVEVDLRKDLSQRQVIRDEAFERIMHAVYEADIALEVSEPEPAPEPAPGEGETKEHARTQKALAWGFGLLGAFTVAAVAYTELIGPEPPLEAGSVWRGRTSCHSRPTTVILEVDNDDIRRGILTIERPPPFQGQQRVRLSGESYDPDGLRVDHIRWQTKPEADFEPIEIHGWEGYIGITGFVEGDCDGFTLYRVRSNE